MLHVRHVEAGVQPRVSTGQSIHAVPSITPSPREGIEDPPSRPPARRCARPSRRPQARRPRCRAGPHGWFDPQTVLEEAAADLVPGPDPDELDPEVAQAIADGTDRLEARLAKAEGDLGGHRQGARSAGRHRAFATDIFTRRGNIFGWAALAWRLGDLLAD